MSKPVRAAAWGLALLGWLVWAPQVGGGAGADAARPPGESLKQASAHEKPGEEESMQAEPMQEVHRRLSVECFNECWTYIDKAQRTPEETGTMLLLACASLWHWSQRDDVGPLNLSIGTWQISRAHALAGDATAARLFAERCLEVSVQAALPPFYLGYAHEALARSALVAGETALAREHLGRAREALSMVTDEESRALLASDLANLEGLLSK